MPANPALAAIVARYRQGEVSAEVTVLSLLLASEDLEAARAAAAGAPALVALLDDNAAGCETVVRMLEGGLGDQRPQEAEAAVASVRRRFDRAVAECEESSVAAYSLGNPAILAAATREVVEEIAAQLPLAAATRVVELGCGIGRFLEALAPRVGTVHGLDLSPAMVEVARRRCAGLSNVTVDLASGRDLAPVADQAADLVLAVDVLPYVVEGGASLVDAIFAEIARVLRPGGAALVFNFSYRGDPARDRAEVTALAARHGFELRVPGVARLRLWDGVLFGLRSARS